MELNRERKIKLGWMNWLDSWYCKMQLHRLLSYVNELVQNICWHIFTRHRLSFIPNYLFKSFTCTLKFKLWIVKKDKGIKLSTTDETWYSDIKIKSQKFPVPTTFQDALKIRRIKNEFLLIWLFQGWLSVVLLRSCISTK